MNVNTQLLSWAQFDTNAPNTFRQLWNDQDFADVTLATVDHQQIKAHKVILSSCSQFFRNILLKNPHPNPLLYLKDIKHKELELVMKFIYLGQCEVGQYDLECFLATGKDLEVIGMMEDVNLKHMEEYVVENRVQKTHETKESSNTDLDETTRAMSNQETCMEVILPSNHLEDEFFACNECNDIFNTSKGLQHHIEFNHEIVKNDCDQCDYKATISHNLISHKQSKHGVGMHSCDQCSYTSNWKKNLVRHKQSKHETNMHDPNQYEYKDSQNASLTSHKKTKHAGLMYTCDQCGSSFTQQGNLTTHKQSQHEGVTYKCDQCDYTASRNCYLTLHKQSKHEGLSYICDHCGNTFVSSSNLTTHKQSQHIGMTFNCDQCDIIFDWKNLLTRHMQSIHNEMTS